MEERFHVVVIVNRTCSPLSRCGNCWYGGGRRHTKSRAAAGGLATAQPPLSGAVGRFRSTPCGCACRRRTIAFPRGVIRRLREGAPKAGATLRPVAVRLGRHQLAMARWGDDPAVRAGAAPWVVRFECIDHNPPASAAMMCRRSHRGRLYGDAVKIIVFRMVYSV